MPFINVSFIPFFVFGHFCRWCYENTKIYYVVFVYILQGKMGKTEKNHATKVTKMHTKNQKTKIWDERNTNQLIFVIQLNGYHSFPYGRIRSRVISSGIQNYKVQCNNGKTWKTWKFGHSAANFIDLKQKPAQSFS